MPLQQGGRKQAGADLANIVTCASEHVEVLASLGGPLRNLEIWDSINAISWVLKEYYVKNICMK